MCKKKRTKRRLANAARLTLNRALRGLRCGRTRRAVRAALQTAHAALGRWCCERPQLSRQSGTRRRDSHAAPQVLQQAASQQLLLLHPTLPPPLPPRLAPPLPLLQDNARARLPRRPEPRCLSMRRQIRAPPPPPSPQPPPEKL
eukprot:1213487-Pleurochrysis_carterae.AAC.3